MFEFFDHTADLGFRVRGATLAELFEQAGKCFSTALIEDLSTVAPNQTVLFSLPYDETDLLLFDWLRGLILQFEENRMLFSAFTVNVNEQGLQATAHGELYDPQKHSLSHEIKAITYHGLRVVPDNDGWLAEVIVDI